jgi:hypothetical protein
MDETLDIFRGDYFSATTLDEVADNVPYQPQALGSLGIFDPKPIRTTTVMVSYKNGSFEIVPTTERGGPETPIGRRDRKLHYFETKALRQKERVNSHELTDILANNRPLEVRLQDAITEVNDRAGIMRTNNEVTLERMRLGALQGILLDADNSVIYDYFAEFGVPAPVAVQFNFATITPNQLVNFIEVNIVRPMIRALGSRAGASVRIGALVGDNFWAGLMTHDAVMRTYLNWQAAVQLRQGLAAPWGQFDFGGVTWMNYRGTDDGTTIAIGVNEAIFFPIGARDVFRNYLSPGERFRDQGKKGQEVYLIVSPDPRENMDEYVDIRVRTYPLPICVFPKALMRGVRTG